MNDYFLYPEERKSLDSWLLQRGIRLNSRTRSLFRDPRPVAGLVAKIHKDLVDLSVYKACSSHSMILNSWKIFEIQVLDKLNIGVSEVDLENLGLGTKGAIDQLLYCIMYTETETL